MIPYPKIETLFDRFPNDRRHVDMTKWRRPEYEYISHWQVTEKVDGTNVRLAFGDGFGWLFRGRSDNAVFTPAQRDFLMALCERMESNVNDTMQRYGLNEITLYGELYGPKIQSGGRYSESLGFRMFDIRINDRLWLDQDSLVANANDWGVDIVPDMGIMSTDDIIGLCQDGFISEFSIDRSYISEGVIAKPVVPLTTNDGKRVMWKLKF